MANLAKFAWIVAVALTTGTALAQDKWVVYPGSDGPGKGKKIVLMAGDEEYRSEEGLPMLGKLLAKHHGFTCVCLFSQNEDTTINPNNQKNIPGTEELNDADLMIILTRFRKLPDEQMKPIEDFLKAGKPVIGMRTSTHAFRGLKGEYAKYNNGYRGKEHPKWKGGFGRFILGEKWISHHGKHKGQATRGLIAPEAKDHPLVRGIEDGDIWGPSDVYGVRLPLPGDSKPIILGAVTDKKDKDGPKRHFGMKPSDPIASGKKNDPMMPVAWVKSYQLDGGEKGMVFNTTMGASTDLESEGLRRLIVNAVYWLLEMDVPQKAKVDVVGEYNPTAYGFNSFKKGVKVSDHKLKE